MFHDTIDPNDLISMLMIFGSSFAYVKVHAQDEDESGVFQ